MSDGYKPRAGTTAATILEFFEKQPAGAEFTGHELEAKLKVKCAAMALRKAVEAGVVVTSKRSNAYVFSLVAPPQPSDGKLTIGNYSDGDVVVQGVQVNEDESVTFTRDQLQQLLQHVTTPHIVGLPAVANFAGAAGAQG